MNYVDVNVLVYWLTDHPEFGERATRIIEEVEEGNRAVTSALTPWILHVVLKNEAEDYDRETMLTLIEQLRGLSIEELTFRDYQRADELAEETGLEMEDAIHLSVARRLDCKKIYTNDADFDDVDIKAEF